MTTITVNQVTDVVTVKVGEVGPQGPEGPQGDEGLSAYEVWLAAGNTGTVEDFLLSSSQYIDGVPVITANLASGDMLTYDSGHWANVPRSELTDGGNF